MRIFHISLYGAVTVKMHTDKVKWITAHNYGNWQAQMTFIQTEI